MALVRLVDREELPPEAQALFDVGQQQYGLVLEAWRAVAHRPAVLMAHVAYLRAIVGPGALDARTKDLVAVRIAVLNHCRYSLSHRVAASRGQGVDEATLAALADPTADPARFSERELAALAFAGELTTGVADLPRHASAHGVSVDTIARVRDLYDDAELVELALTVSLWNALTRLHRVLGLDLDLPAPPPDLDARL